MAESGIILEPGIIEDPGAKLYSAGEYSITSPRAACVLAFFFFYLLPPGDPLLPRCDPAGACVCAWPRFHPALPLLAVDVEVDAMHDQAEASTPTALTFCSDATPWNSDRVAFPPGMAPVAHRAIAQWKDGCGPRGAKLSLTVTLAPRPSTSCTTTSAFGLGAPRPVNSKDPDDVAWIVFPDAPAPDEGLCSSVNESAQLQVPLVQL